MPAKKSKLGVLLLAVMLYPATAAMAAPKQEKPHPGETHKMERNDARDADAASAAKAIAGAVFTELERRMICDYFKSIHCGADGRNESMDENIKRKTALPPPGLAKRDALPPGLEKQVQRNGALPPGLQKRGLPEDLAGRLPRRGDAYERVIVGDDVVLILIATGIVLDILEGAAAGK